MRERVVVIVAFLVGLTALGCAPSPYSVQGFMQPDSGGIKRAAFELDCAESQLRVTDLGNGSIGVSGCGKKSVYVYAYGSWVNNSGGDSANSESAKK